MKRDRCVPLVAAALLVTCGIPGPAGGQPGLPIDANPFLALLPALRTAPAPAWVKPGTRMTYQAGGVFTQVTVVAITQQIAVLDLQYLTQANGAAAIPVFGGALGVPGAGVDWWLSPQVLRGAAGLAAPGVAVAQLRYPLGGREYNAVRFEAADQQRHQVWVFDADSGVLLFHTTTTGARGGALTLVGVRTLTVPWAQSPAPGWVGTTGVLRFQGSTTFYVQGAAPVSIPLSVTYQRQHGGANWALYQQTTVQATPPGLPPVPAEGVRVIGCGLLGGLWLPPQGLAQLRAGQTLDADPITGITTSVAQRGPTPQGADAITLTEMNQAHRIDGVYDLRSGALLFVRLVDNVLRTETSLQLAGRQ